MSEETGAPAGDITIVSAPADAPESMGANEAAKMLADLRWKRNNPDAPAPEQAAVEPAELSDEDNADPEEVPGETEEIEPADDLPPIERPRSWAKDLDEEWASYPRAAQEKIVAREQERDAAIRRSQNDAAEERKAAKAERDQAEQARKTYEAKLPEVERNIQEFLSANYADIRTMADVEKMALEDPFRKIQWDTHQQKIAGIMREAEQAKQRQAEDRNQSLAKYQKEETDKLSEFVPEVKDPEKRAALTTKAIDHLKAHDFTDNDLAQFAAQGDKPFIFSAGFQRILVNSLKYEDLQKAPPKAAPKTVPPVQRPGTARPSGSAASDRLQSIVKQFEREPTLENATALRLARQKARA